MKQMIKDMQTKTLTDMVNGIAKQNEIFKDEIEKLRIVHNVQEIEMMSRNLCVIGLITHKNVIKKKENNLRTLFDFLKTSVRN